MQSEREMAKLFSDFIKHNNLSASNLLLVMNFCVRELSARSAIDRADVDELYRKIEEVRKGG